ncbi:MAG: SRPBCC domain-containing protein [Xanthomonadales bacterium]|nr:SRPBCC domain-containing protein [Xanthomonadales bacterium]
MKSLALILLLLPGVSVASEVQALVKQVDVAADMESAWAAWTTESGLESFFSREANIELRVGGQMDIHFFPGNPPGTRGAEGMVVLAVEPGSRIAFTWDAPPTWPEIRKQRTLVAVSLQPVDEKTTRVRLEQTGWGQSEDWTAVYEYFDGAWDTVLGRLQQRFVSGPVDWDLLTQ